MREEVREEEDRVREGQVREGHLEDQGLVVNRPATKRRMREDQLREGHLREGEVEVEAEEHPPGACVVGDDGAFPEYRHARQGKSDTVDHPLGDQPEGVVEDPVTYPPDQLPPALEELPPDSGGSGSSGTALETEGTEVSSGGFLRD
jgi:hypothetical protein